MRKKRTIHAFDGRDFAVGFQRDYVGVVGLGVRLADGQLLAAQIVDDIGRAQKGVAKKRVLGLVGRAAAGAKGIGLLGLVVVGAGNAKHANAVHALELAPQRGALEDVLVVRKRVDNHLLERDRNGLAVELELELDLFVLSGGVAVDEGRGEARDGEDVELLVDGLDDASGEQDEGGAGVEDGLGLEAGEGDAFGGESDEVDGVRGDVGGAVDVVGDERQGGEVADVLFAVDAAKEKGAVAFGDGVEVEAEDGGLNEALVDEVVDDGRVLLLGGDAHAHAEPHEAGGAAAGAGETELLLRNGQVVANGDGVVEVVAGSGAAIEIANLETASNGGLVCGTSCRVDYGLLVTAVRQELAQKS